MRIAVLVKQVPRAEEMTLGPDGRLVRDGVDLEMNAYCRRAVSKGVELAEQTGGVCWVYTLGPQVAEAVLREAVAWGADVGVLVSDPACAGSDTLATARVLAAALDRDGPWDLVLVGRNSIDSDTGQVGPELAELMDLPFAAAARELTVGEGYAEARCERDDGWRRVRVELPAVLSVAERLTDPCKVDEEGRRAVSSDRLRTVSASQLGPGPFGVAGSPTRVGSVRVFGVSRRQVVLTGPVERQAEHVADLLRSWWNESPPSSSRRAMGRSDLEGSEADVVLPRRASRGRGAVVAALLEPERDRQARELLGEATRLADLIGGRATGVGPRLPIDGAVAGWPGQHFVSLQGVEVEEDVAHLVTDWCEEVAPWAVLAPGTLWGREVAARVAARLGVGMTGDAVELEVEGGVLVAWKPAFGGRSVAAITSESEVQVVTVRPGVLPLPARLERDSVSVETRTGRSRRRLTVLSADRDDDIDDLLSAPAVLCVGQGVDPQEYDRLQPLRAALRAELAATRKVTDRGWLPRSRQVGITGHAIAPELAVLLGVSGKFNHMAGLTRAGTIVAVNVDPVAPVFEWADVGMVADWRDAVPALASVLSTGSGVTVPDLGARPR